MICILLVDDNNIARTVLCRQLCKEGYGVMEAESGPVALTMLLKSKFQLVLLDFVMQPMTGLEVLQRIRRSYTPNELPVVMMSSTRDAELVLRATQLGANDFVFRPFQLQEILRKILHQLEEAKPA
jgi:CheY-like chemotaxis protein